MLTLILSFRSLMAGTSTLFLMNDGSLLPKTVSLESVIDVDRTVTALSSLSVRDKLCRTLQYAAKTLKTFASASPSSSFLGLSASELGGLASSLSMARKGFRLFKSLDMYAAFRKATTESDPLLRIAASIRALGFGMYLLYDNWVFLVKAKFAQDPNLALRVARAYKFWFLGLLASIVRQVYLLSGLISRYNAAVRAIPANPDNPDLALSASKLEAKITKASLSLFKDLCDAPIPLNALGWGGFLSPSLRFASFTGTISSIIGLYLAYPDS